VQVQLEHCISYAKTETCANETEALDFWSTPREAIIQLRTWQLDMKN